MVKQSGQVDEFYISFFQQFPRLSDLSRLGDDIHHDVVMYFDDVRDAAKACNGDTGVADHRILLRYLYEHRTCIKDLGRWFVFHAQGLHQGCCLCVRCFHIHCTSNILKISNLIPV